MSVREQISRTRVLTDVEHLRTQVNQSIERLGAAIATLGVSLQELTANVKFANEQVATLARRLERIEREQEKVRQWLSRPWWLLFRR